MNADDPDLQRPDEEAIKEVTGNSIYNFLDDFLNLFLNFQTTQCGVSYFR